MSKVWKKVTMGVALILAGLIAGEAQISVPHSLSNPVTVSQLNTNFSTIGGGALNRAGGTITGNIAVSNGVTIDGVDISAALGSSADQTFDTLTLANTGAGALDVAGGINAGSGNVGIVDTTGKIPALSSTYLANLSASNLTIGAVGLSDYIYTATTYTPTWTATVSNPSLGNGTLTGRYTKVGRQVTAHVQLIVGSTTTFGSGQWVISLPTTTSSSGLLALGQMLVTDVSAGGIPYLGTAAASVNASTVSLATETNPVTGTLPITFAVDDRLNFTITYESAS